MRGDAGRAEADRVYAGELREGVERGGDVLHEMVENPCAVRGIEVFLLSKSGDSFRKIVITAGSSRMWTDDEGMSYAGILTFLLAPTSLMRAV